MDAFEQEMENRSGCNDDGFEPEVVTLDSECEECGHKIRLHNDKYGCEYERGDAWVEGNNCGGLVAQGPCGCTAWTVEDIKELSKQTAMDWIRSGAKVPTESPEVLAEDRARKKFNLAPRSL